MISQYPRKSYPFFNIPFMSQLRPAYGTMIESHSTLGLNLTLNSGEKCSNQFKIIEMDEGWGYAFPRFVQGDSE